MPEWIISCVGGMWDAMMRARCCWAAATAAWARGRCGLWRCRPQTPARGRTGMQMRGGWEVVVGRYVFCSQQEFVIRVVRAPS